MTKCSCGITPKGNVCLCGKIVNEIKVKTKTGINQVSEKQKVINAEKKTQMKKFKKERLGICSGCDKKFLLSNSHLVPVSQNKKLELEEENQVWHCLDECHPKWEHDKQGRKLMLDYYANMEKIKNLDNIYYNLLISKHGF
jgi:hypothetical protein